MSLRAVFLATSAASAFLLLPGCGGSTDDTTSSTGGGGSSTTTSSGGGSTTTSSGGGSTTTNMVCQSQPVVGGNLSVATQGPVGVTLISTGGLSGYGLGFLYDYVFGMSTNNAQDKWGSVEPFPPGTPAGASTQVQLQPPPPDLSQGQSVAPTFPKGIPIELRLNINDGNQPGPSNSSSTASIGKDISHDDWHTASVVYASNSTATVTFFLGGGPSLSVGLTNVVGSGTPSSC